MTLGSTIRRLRKERKISQGAFAKQIGIGQVWLSFIETGRKEPRTETLRKICGGLGVSVMAVYVMSLDESDVPESKRELFRLLEGPIKNMLERLI